MLNINYLFNNLDNDTKVVLGAIALFSIILLVIGVVGASLGKQTIEAKAMTVGDQFTVADLDGGTGRIISIPTACDATTIMVPSLYNEGFSPYSIGNAADIRGKAFAMTFWKRLSMIGLTIIVTTSHDMGITCIISISNNVTDIQENEGTNGQKVTPSTQNQQESAIFIPL